LNVEYGFEKNQKKRIVIYTQTIGGPYMDGVSTFFAAAGTVLGTAGMINSYRGNRVLGGIEQRLAAGCFLIASVAQPVFANTQPARQYYDPILFPPEQPEDVRVFKFYNQDECTPGIGELVKMVSSGIKTCLEDGSTYIQNLM
jgi:hypothetical protein